MVLVIARLTLGHFKQARAGISHTMTITVECDNLVQLLDVIESGADIALLDNMCPNLLKQAVTINAGRLKLEASGGINEDTIAEIAQTGVDIISVGALTHSAGSERTMQQTTV